MKITGDVAGAVWYKSQFTGTITINDIKWSVKVRSVTECCYQCTFSSKCRSFQYETESGKCTLLFALGQTGPFVNSSEIVHYRNNLVCPEGYYLLSISNACVVLYPDYMSWNDSLIACQSEGADFPILNTDTLFNEFLDYIDNRVVSPDRVAVNGRLINNIGYWGNGDVIDASKFCAFQPDEIGNQDICLFMAHSNENWYGSHVNRLDDNKCVINSLRICMIKL
ncbi:Hypothetical predicted protein [Mytilus galloprovincialis]|uniref:Apple domain-containing protein n=1 Tax=Mytilus galloprovincialis TaxID=29158 RepID=A0A8B6F8A1_MYTGA|nr:Hypothetical predicted protein [Mytilus galloprovincialis]